MAEEKKKRNSKIEKIREEICGEVLCVEEIEEILKKYGYEFVETEDEDTDDGVIKFTNFKSEVWVIGEEDGLGYILIEKVVLNTRLSIDGTRVDPFHSYDDLKAVLDFIKNTGNYDFWLCAWMGTLLGRRVGDTLRLRWSDLYDRNGEFRTQLTQLKEEKTGKRVAPPINELACKRIQEYCDLKGINPMDNYNHKIFDYIKTKQDKKKTYESFRLIMVDARVNLNIQYRISTHSFRKYYGNTLYRLHPQDANNLFIIQTLLGHSDLKTTITYIGEVQKTQIDYLNDYSDYMFKKEIGVDAEISNSPIVTLKAEDFREIIGKCYDMAAKCMDKFDVLNEVIGMAEQYTGSRGWITV